MHVDWRRHAAEGLSYLRHAAVEYLYRCQIAAL
jgi:hypothetical protein